METFSAVTQFLAVPILLAFGLPWALLAHRAIPPANRSFENLIDHLCLGYAISFVALFVCSQLALWAFIPVWVVGLLAAARDL